MWREQQEKGRKLREMGRWQEAIALKIEELRREEGGAELPEGV